MTMTEPEVPAPPPAPTVMVSAPVDMATGVASPVTVTWTSTNQANVTLDVFDGATNVYSATSHPVGENFLATDATSHAVTVEEGSATRRVVVTVESETGVKVTDDATFTTAAPPAPTATIDAPVSTDTVGNFVVVRWSSTNQARWELKLNQEATTTELDSWSGTDEVSLQVPFADHEFDSFNISLKVWNSADVAATATVAFAHAAAEAPTVTITNPASTPAAGEPAMTLEWDSTNQSSWLVTVFDSSFGGDVLVTYDPRVDSSLAPSATEVELDFGTASGGKLVRVVVFNADGAAAHADVLVWVYADPVRQLGTVVSADTESDVWQDDWRARMATRRLRQTEYESVIEEADEPTPFPSGTAVPERPTPSVGDHDHDHDHDDDDDGSGGAEPLPTPDQAAPGVGLHYGRMKTMIRTGIKGLAVDRDGDFVTFLSSNWLLYEHHDGTHWFRPPGFADGEGLATEMGGQHVVLAYDGANSRIVEVPVGRTDMSTAALTYHALPVGLPAANTVRGLMGRLTTTVGEHHQFWVLTTAGVLYVYHQPHTAAEDGTTILARRIQLEHQLTDYEFYGGIAGTDTLDTPRMWVAATERGAGDQVIAKAYQLPRLTDRTNTSTLTTSDRLPEYDIVLGQQFTADQVKVCNPQGGSSGQSIGHWLVVATNWTSNPQLLGVSSFLAFGAPSSSVRAAARAEVYNNLSVELDEYPRGITVRGNLGVAYCLVSNSFIKAYTFASSLTPGRLTSADLSIPALMGWTARDITFSGQNEFNSELPAGPIMWVLYTEDAAPLNNQVRGYRFARGNWSAQTLQADDDLIFPPGNFSESSGERHGFTTLVAAERGSTIVVAHDDESIQKHGLVIVDSDPATQASRVLNNYSERASTSALRYGPAFSLSGGSISSNRFQHDVRVPWHQTGVDAPGTYTYRWSRTLIPLYSGIPSGSEVGGMTFYDGNLVVAYASTGELFTYGVGT